ncbi:MAG: SRPBCC family protein [Gemmatimonas sp.]
MSDSRFEYVTYIDTTVDKVWNALTDPRITRLYWGGWSLRSAWKVGTPVRLVMESAVDEEGVPTEQGTTIVSVQGQVLECERPRRLSYSWHVQLVEEMRREQPSRVVFELQPVGQTVKLTLTHDGFAPAGITVQGIRCGWPVILSSLKTYLERGTTLDISAPESDDAAQDWRSGM